MLLLGFRDVAANSQKALPLPKDFSSLPLILQQNTFGSMSFDQIHLPVSLTPSYLPHNHPLLLVIIFM